MIENITISEVDDMAYKIGKMIENHQELKVKYDKLVKFIKPLSIESPDRDDWRDNLAIEIQELLKEIGE